MTQPGMTDFCFLSWARAAGEGQVTCTYQYNAFGTGHGQSDCLDTGEWSPGDTGATRVNRIRYTGQQYDPATGQYYLRARFYNPLLGRFLQEDVYRGDGLNLYAYCGNNPVKYYDPSGYGKKNCKQETQDKSGSGGAGSSSVKRINVGGAGHHVPAVKKSKGRPFEVAGSNKSRPTLFSKGSDPGYDHWRLHDAERNYVGPRQGDFNGTDSELFDAYRNAYKGLEDIKADVKSPNGTYILGEDVTPYQVVNLLENWLTEQGLR